METIRITYGRTVSRNEIEEAFDLIERIARFNLIDNELTHEGEHDMFGRFQHTARRLVGLTRTCPDCDGYGAVAGIACVGCGGSGVVFEI